MGEPRRDRARKGAGDGVLRDAVAALTGAFAQRPLVGFAEEHGSVAQHAFLRALLADRRFAEMADAVVVEFGNARLQATIDRYVAGDEVSQSELEPVWLETTQRRVWAAPMYGAFFAAARAANATLPVDRRIRVLLGDPPIARESLNDRRELERLWGQRSAHFAEVVEREVLADGRRALLVAGGHHLFRGNPRNETGLLEQAHPGSVFVVLPHGQVSVPLRAYEQRLSGWPVPSLAPLRGSWVGELPVSVLGDGSSEETRSRLADVADAFLYLGSDRGNS